VNRRSLLQSIAMLPLLFVKGRPEAVRVKCVSNIPWSSAETVLWLPCVFPKGCLTRNEMRRMEGT
jgi:hypothetical protein